MSKRTINLVLSVSGSNDLSLDEIKRDIECGLINSTHWYDVVEISNGITIELDDELLVNILKEK